VTAAVDNVPAPGGGRIGLVHCPGAAAAGLLSADSAAALDADLATLAEWGAEALVTLVQPFELKLLGVEDLGERAGRLGLAWSHLPIVDGAAPGTRFEEAWGETGPDLHRRLDAEGRIVLHCRAGIGRTGTIAARLLIERGVRPERAITLVRRARPGAIESPEQAAWVRACRRASGV
jgi:ADP-ribosyl-[dinitrogen reductase] hydrolase